MSKTTRQEPTDSPELADATDPRDRIAADYEGPCDARPTYVFWFRCDDGEQHAIYVRESAYAAAAKEARRRKVEIAERYGVGVEGLAAVKVYDEHWERRENVGWLERAGRVLP